MSLSQISPANITSDYKKEGSYSLGLNNGEGNRFETASALSFGSGYLGISLWLLEGNTGTKTIFDNRVGGTGAGMWLTITGSGSTAYLTLYTNDGVTTGSTVTTAAVTLSYSVFTHIFVRFIDVDVGMANIYVNGVLATSGADSTVQAGWNSDQIMSFGATRIGGGTLYGYIDHIQIYTCYLNDTKIADLYTTGATYTEETCPAGGGEPADVVWPIAHWMFNNDWIDEMVNYDGTAVNGAGWGSTTPDPQEGNAYADFSNAQSYMVTTNNIDLSSGPVTIVFSVYNNYADNTLGTIFSNVTSPQLWFKGINVTIDYLAGNFIRIIAWDGAGNNGIAYSADETVPEDEWTHVALRWYDITKANVTIWINGVLDENDSIAYEGAGINGVFNIAKGGGTYDLEGYIDNFRIYKNALTGAQIDSLYEHRDEWYVLGQEGEPLPGGLGKWYFDATGGNNANDGHFDVTPKQTIAHLNAYLALDSIGAGDTIFLKRGEVWRESLSINGVDGTALNKIVLSAYGTGNKPELRGYKILGAFSETSGVWSIVDAALPSYFFNVRAYGSPPYGKYISTYNWLLIDGVKYSISRYPDTGYLTCTDWSTADPPVYIQDDDHPFGNDYWTDAQISYTDEPWYMARSKVHYEENMAYSRYDFVSGFTSQALDEISYSANKINGWYPKYFISNHVNALSTNGEWVYDYATHTLRVKWGAGFNLRVTEFPDRDSVMYIGNSDYWDIENIKFTGAYQNTVKMYQCDHILMDSCEFQYTPTWAVMGVYNSNITYNKCVFSDATGTAISHTVCNNETVQDCRAERIGIVDAMVTDNDDGGPAFFRTAWHEGTVDVLRNYIDSVGYCGTHIRATSTYGSTPGDEYEYGNLIKNSGLVLTDGASIYFYDNGEVDGISRIVSNNIIISADGNVGFTGRNKSEHSGIYLDGAASDYKIINNFVTDCRFGVYLNGTYYNTIRGNTFYNNRRNHGSYAAAIMGQGWGATGQTHDCRFISNIAILRDSTDEHGYIWVDDESSVNTDANIVDTNLYFNPFNEDLKCMATAIDWGTVTRRTIGDMRIWYGFEIFGFFNANNWTYQDVDPNDVSRDEFVTVFKNWSASGHYFKLGDCHMINLDGGPIQDSVLVGAYDTYVLFYVSGTIGSVTDDLYVGVPATLLARTRMIPWLGQTKRQMKLHLNGREMYIHKKD